MNAKVTHTVTLRHDCQTTPVSAEPLSEARRKFMDSVTPMTRPEVPGSIENIASWRRDAERRLDDFLATLDAARSLSDGPDPYGDKAFIRGVGQGWDAAVARSLSDTPDRADPERGEGLDVERLASAFERAYRWTPTHAWQQAQRVAVEYAALSTSVPSEEEET